MRTLQELVDLGTYEWESIARRPDVPYCTVVVTMPADVADEEHAQFVGGTRVFLHRLVQGGAVMVAWHQHARSTATLILDPGYVILGGGSSEAGRTS